MFKKNKIDYSILGFVFIFFLISVVTINSALTYLPSDVGNLALKQVIWYGVGLLLVFIILRLRMSTYIEMLGSFIFCVIYYFCVFCYLHRLLITVSVGLLFQRLVVSNLVSLPR